ncbi:MAG: flippase-like domain-containing protein, partial [Chloroflexi bacterium]|nr:flippase-like domain-containing protein [Chloroflexota bacterium]
MQFSNWRFWIGLAVSGLFLLLLLLRVDRQEIVSALRDANYLYVVPAIGLYFVAVYFRSIRWAYILSPIAQFPATRLYPVVIIGYMANNLLPVRLGELVRSYYLARRETVSGSTALATVAVERLYDGVALLFFAAISAPALLLLGLFQGTGSFSRTTALVFTIGTVGIFALAFAFLVLAARPGFSKLVDAGLSLAPAKARPALSDLVHRFIGGLQVLNSPRRHLGVFLLSWPVWLLEGGMYLLVGYSFGIHLL